MRIAKNLAARAAGALFALGIATGAGAGVIYQSIPDLSVAAGPAWCSQCGSDGQNIGQSFTLSSAAVANTLSFVTDNWYSWPTSVTVDIFQDGGGNTLGANLYHQTFSTFLSDVNTGLGTDIVTVDLGSVGLAAGSYDLFIFNPNDLTFPGFFGGSGLQIVQHGAGGTGPSTGNNYTSLGTDGGVRLDGTSSGAVPEPASWALMLGGFGLVGGAMRSRLKAVVSFG